MRSERLPRFKRSTGIRAFQLTPRDLDILRHIHRQRFLRSDQIVALAEGSRQQVLRRLQLLYHHRYLERPRAQIEYYHQGGSRNLVYGLAAKGRNLLHKTTGDQTQRLKRNTRQLYLQHTLLVAEVVTSLELACRSQSQWKFRPQDELLASRQSGWQIIIRQGATTKRVGVYPDQIFSVEDTTSGKQTIFLLEADRATMPVERRGLSQSSVYRKLLGYEALWAKKLLQQQFPSARFRVLIITTSAARTQRIENAVAKLTHGRGLFLCRDLKAFQGAADTLAELMGR